MSFLFGGQKAQATPPQYTGLQIQTATNTLPVPILMGRTKLSPNLIWADDFKAIAHTQKQSGGKGGGGSASSTSYTYSLSVIMALCEGPIQQVTTVWANQTTSTLSALGFTLVTGTTDQQPWGYVATAHPSASMAYPWTAYVCQANYDMGDSNSLPNHNYEVYGLFTGSGINGQGDADVPMPLWLRKRPPGKPMLPRNDGATKCVSQAIGYRSPSTAKFGLTHPHRSTNDFFFPISRYAGLSRIMFAVSIFRSKPNMARVEIVAAFGMPTDVDGSRPQHGHLPLLPGLGSEGTAID